MFQQVGPRQMRTVVEESTSEAIASRVTVKFTPEHPGPLSLDVGIKLDMPSVERYETYSANLRLFTVFLMAHPGTLSSATLSIGAKATKISAKPRGLLRSEVAVQAEARAAAEGLAGEVGSGRSTVIGGYDVVSGRVAAGYATRYCCAEGMVEMRLNVARYRIRFVEALRPRTGEIIGPCARCRLLYSPDQFAPGTDFQSGAPVR